MTLKSILTLVVHAALILVFVGCNQSNSERKSYLDVINPKFIKSSIFGVTAEDSSFSILGKPEILRTDEQGNVFIADNASLKINIFAKNGRFISSIGGRGRSEGQYFHISAMNIDRTNKQIFVVDNILSRWSISRYDGTLIASDSTEIKTVLWPRSAFFHPNKNLLLLFKLPRYTINGVERNAHDKLIHEFKLEKEEFIKVGSFVDVDLNGDIKKIAVDVFSQLQPGHIAIMKTGDILYMPSLYDGRIYTYHLSHSRWKRGTTIGADLGVAYDLLRSEPSDETRKISLIYKSKQSRQSGLTLNRQGLGVFELEQGEIISLYWSRGNKDGSIMMDIFSPHGTNLGSFDMSRQLGYISGSYSSSPINILWKDDEQYLYIYNEVVRPRVVEKYKIKLIE